jgi:hypothetical protein
MSSSNLAEKRLTALRSAALLSLLGYMIEVRPDEVMNGFPEAWCDNVNAALVKVDNAIAANESYYGFKGQTVDAWRQLHEDVPAPAPGILLQPEFDHVKELEDDA